MIPELPIDEPTQREFTDQDDLDAATRADWELKNEDMKGDDDGCKRRR